MTAPLTSVCPVCAGPIQASRRGRPAVYCGKPCRQAAHRARDRAARALQDLAHLQRRLAADVDQLARLAAELTTLHTSTAVASAPAAAGSDPHSDADGVTADRAVPGPSTGWEPQLAELARRTASVATSIASAARSHRSTAADYRHSARIAGPHPAP